MPTDPRSLSDENAAEIQSAIFAGRKIEAIRLHRNATGMGLKESKDFIVAVEAELRRTAPDKFTAPPAKGCRTAAMGILGIVALVAGLAVLVV